MDRKERDMARSRAAGLIAAATTVAREDVALADLVANPENPRGADLGDLSELRDSMKSLGILQPLLVCSRDAFMASRPGLELPLAAFVVLAGHRRLAAALEAGLESAPVVVRDDLARVGVSEAIAVAENQQRKALDALQEAGAMASLRDRAGKSVREIAALIGCSAGHVSKRLALLTLPAEVLTHVESGRMAASTAYVLTQLVKDVGDDRLAAATVEELSRGFVTRSLEVWDERDLRDAVKATRQTLAKADAIDRLKTEHVDVVEVVPFQQRLHDDAEIEAARQDGTLIAALSYDGEPIYGTSRPAPSPTDQGVAENDKVKERRAVLGDLRRSRDRRRDVLGEVLRRRMDAAEKRRWVAEMAPEILSGFGLDSQRRDLLAKVLDVEPCAWHWDASARVEWMVKAGLDEYQALRAAWVAARESMVRIPGSTSEWHTMGCSITAEYAVWLEQVGLPITPVETEHLLKTAKEN